MDNLRSVIKNLFCYIAPAEILKGNVTYDNINEDTFLKLGNGYIDRYTNDEIRNMYSFLESEFQWHNCKLTDTPPKEGQKDIKLNVFDALTAFNYGVLIEENGVPLCQYQNLLRWRDMITMLEEDIFNTSFLAMEDTLSGKDRYYFFWKPVIGHNNYALNKLVARGISENHFHLKGSAPQFHLSWLSIMNNIKSVVFKQTLLEYDNNKLQKNINYDVQYNNDSLVVMWRQAALIRLFLFAAIKDEELEFGHVYITYGKFLKVVNAQEREYVKGMNENHYLLYDDIIDVNQYFDELSYNTIHKIKMEYSKVQVFKMLNDYQLLEGNLDVVQSNINRLKDLIGKSKYDYTICQDWLVHNPNNALNEVISGERWFMYSMFLKVYTKDKKFSNYMNWFYLYLVLKSNIRMELVQTNKTVGFDNFQNYQNRKEQLIKNTVYEYVYMKMAVRDTILNQHIISLEARISPQDSEYELIKSIRNYDYWICNGLSDLETNKLKKRYFYVIHFIKEPDIHQVGLCRHYKTRKRVEKQAKAIALIRKKGVIESERIHGIDACSSEIGCRPEIFAHAFRYLKGHSQNQELKNGLISEGIIQQRSIMETYHVGEDFLDIIDGLRAIDEAINFLNMKCGDRLGHALALGIDIDDWYSSKSNRILISKQDYLDNLMWLHSKIRKYGLDDCNNEYEYTQKRFNEYFNDIYRNNINLSLFEKINDFNFGIEEYYASWKLRGDDPELYAIGSFKAKDIYLDDWDYYGVNRTYPQNYQIRYRNSKATFLYYMYHYNEDVIKIGKQMVEVKVNPSVIDAIKKVRERMQRDIARIGIGIEANPSSNYFIGTFRRYDKHPIIDWYNLGLTHDNELLKKSPQLQVSINTDDQGVFATYLENEYAYMALALEKCKDEKGEYLYNRTDILQWLNNIRQMGNDQSFVYD